MALSGGGCTLFRDHCEELCGELSDRIEPCMADTGFPMSWADLGARSRADFEKQCRKDWDQATADLTSRELELALEECDQTSERIAEGDFGCQEIVALYGPVP